MTQDRAFHFLSLPPRVPGLQEAVILDDSDTLVSTVNQARAGCLANAAFPRKCRHEGWGWLQQLWGTWHLEANLGGLGQSVNHVLRASCTSEILDRTTQGCAFLSQQPLSCGCGTELSSTAETKQRREAKGRQMRAHRGLWTLVLN